MPLMDEFKEEREKIKTAPLKVKWKYFQEYYLKMTIGIIIVAAILIAILVTTLTHKEEMLYVCLVNYDVNLEVNEDELIDPFEQEHLENTKKQEITLDSNENILGEGKQASDAASMVRYSYEDEQKITMVVMIGQMDMMISGEDVIDKYIPRDYFKSLEEVYSQAELKNLEDAGLIKYYQGTPIAVCVDASEKLNKHYYYVGEKTDHYYAAFTYGAHTDLAKEFLKYIGY